MKLPKILLAAASLAICAAPQVQAATIAQWDIEGVTTPPDATNAVAGLAVLASTGTGTLSGVHANNQSDWTTPSGPASANSYSANTWTPGDFYHFTTSSLGFENLTVSFDATGSNTGPRDFEIAYSTDGITYTPFATYALINASWSADVAFVNPAAAHFDFDFSSIPVLDNAPVASFRLMQVGTVSIGGGTVATAGTSRIDNITVAGSPIIPEPRTFTLAGLGLISSLLVRRRD
jgi:hypothetical protein